jgi:hypothetical protein
MLSYNNNHIFTGYLKQLLSSFSLPACKVYTREFADYLEKHGVEDPRVLKSFNSQKDRPTTAYVNYLKNDELYSYLTNDADLSLGKAYWKKSANVYYSCDKFIPGLTRNLNSPGITYDSKTHEYLGDYLRFIRDYYNVNLMSLYNCFTDKLCSNVYFSFILNPKAAKAKQVKVLFDAQEPAYRLYALPVKLFAEYTIAIDCDQGIEMFCGFYNTNLDMSEKAEDLAARTYQRVHKTLFKQPFLYDKLTAKYWSDQTDFTFKPDGTMFEVKPKVFTRWDLTNREKDLRLFIKVPASCRSSITILEGDYRNFNDAQYALTKYKQDGTVFNPNVDSTDTVKNTVWTYKNNHCILNFDTSRSGDCINLNNYAFNPISQVQLLAFNTGESYPFADRLIEYLGGSAITPMESIPDNIKRVQKVMNQNNYYFKVDGLWEDKMQNIIYDYMMNSGPIKVVKDNKGNQVLKDIREGYHRQLGHNSKSTLFDVLGYVDKNAEKWYASWSLNNNNATVGTSLQSVDIYDGLYDI